MILLDASLLIYAGIVTCRNTRPSEPGSESMTALPNVEPVAPGPHDR
jgi:hypothetical protein